MTIPHVSFAQGALVVIPTNYDSLGSAGGQEKSLNKTDPDGAHVAKRDVLVLVLLTFARQKQDIHTRNLFCTPDQNLQCARPINGRDSGYLYPP